MITIKFNDNIKHTYNSFEEILELDSYNKIIYINYSYNNLSSLPELPNSLEYLNCTSNNLSRLPELPNSLTHLYCYHNNLSYLPKLPNSLTYLHCGYNNLSSLPELPNSLTHLYCGFNKLSILPELSYLLTQLVYNDNPIYIYIEKYFNDNYKKYFEHQKNTKKKFINKIETWFLDCKYNPKYLYCRKRLMKEYEELYI
jgi:Leucine-rich repeat (LRR) protein